MVQNNEPRNVPLTSDERAAIPQQTPIFTEPPDPPQAEQHDLELMFPCKYPVSPHMRNEDSRFQTFDERWSANNVQATPQQISKAGFFYIGERDRVKCWYCNGGLQNWDPQDEPWTEHAKWFPTCEFLLQRKGPDFVYRMVSMFPNLARPLLRGTFDVPPTQGGNRIQFGSQLPRAPTPPTKILDPQVKLGRKTQIDRVMASDFVKTAIEFGFTTRLVRKVVERRISHSAMYSSFDDFLGPLLDEPTNDNQELTEDEDSDDHQEEQLPHDGDTESDSDDEKELNDVMQSEIVLSVYQALCDKQWPKVERVVKRRLSEGGKYTTVAELLKDVQQDSDMESMEHRIYMLQEERKCKVCLDQLSTILFVPCRHLCCCERCSQSLRKCPVCREKIEKAIRTYMP